jgi:hypothetical protein
MRHEYKYQVVPPLTLNLCGHPPVPIASARWCTPHLGSRFGPRWQVAELEAETEIKRGMTDPAVIDEIVREVRAALRPTKTSNWASGNLHTTVASPENIRLMPMR